MAGRSALLHYRQRRRSSSASTLVSVVSVCCLAACSHHRVLHLPEKSGIYKINVGKEQYHRDTIASEKRTLNRTARSGMHRRAAPPPQPAALSHCATLARRSRSASTTWTATRAAQSWVKMVSIVRRDSIVLQSTHLDAAVLLPVLTLSRSLMCLPPCYPPCIIPAHGAASAARVPSISLPTLTAPC